MNGGGITIIGASAGSGKTYRLTQEVTRALDKSAEDRVDVEGLVAVTFTQKAHAELEARIRSKLVADGAYEDALRLPLAYVGTVHAAALRLLQEFALDAGLSPSVDVVAGNETKLLRQALERSLDASSRERLDELAARLELRQDGKTGRHDWVTPVADIMDLARSNRIAADALPAMADHSVARLLALLPRPTADARALEEALAREIAPAIAALRAAEDDTDATARALDRLVSSKRRLADGELRWSAWAQLASIAPAKRLESTVRGVRAAAASYEVHPRLHEDLAAMTHAIFDAARAGLVAYQAWKKERRVVDYVDMLDGALDLVEHPRARAELGDRLRFVVVDEFQDTSPIQLALFLRLHALAGRSVWVGDRKQCIFEYAGADPALMDTVAGWVAAHDGARDRLEHNHRSRPELVRACSEIFAAALARYGFARSEVVVAPRREAPAALAPLPPFAVWALEVDTKAAECEAIASGVRRTLDAAHATPVLDRLTKEVRPVRPGDIAILVATNAQASALAVALHARGVRVALARAGLFETPEGVLIEAALGWLLDGSDALAEAVVDALTGWRGGDPDAWLAERLRHVATRSAAKDATATADELGTATPEASSTSAGWQRALEVLRPRLAVLSPSEALDAVLAALDAVHLCARWPDPAQRVANLDAIRGVASAYEARCGQEREAATVAGLLRYIDALRAPTLQRDEVLPSDDQHVPSDDGAVVVCTYHKSKGLEWPVVVLADLDRSERRNAFEVTSESAGQAFDPENPLAGRTIRYWPWPFGQTKKVPLAAAAAESAEGRAVAAREDQERARLLYVGFTRARDHLVLAVRVKGGKAKLAWLDALSTESGDPVLDLPFSAREGDEAKTRVRAESGPLEVATRVLRLDGTRRLDPVEPATPVWFARPITSSAAPPLPYRIVPSAEVAGWPDLDALVARARLGAVEHLPSAIPLEARTYEDDVLGTAIHAFLAADVEGLPAPARLERAGAIIAGAGLGAVLRAESLLASSDGLRAWVARRWPNAVWHREIPLEGTISSEQGDRRVSGIIDLLLETASGYVLLDHKTFPGRGPSAWRAKCAEFIPQLAAYALVLAMTGNPVEACWVHLPVGGGMVEVVLDVRASLDAGRARRGRSDA